MPKRSKKKLRLFENIYDNTNTGPGSRKRIDGRLHIRVVGASQLAAGDHHLFRKGTSDPFCVVVYRDDAGFYSRRRTRTIERSREPAWREQFTFGVREGTDKVTIDFDVWDEDCDEKTDDFLGTASRVVDLNNLTQANMWRKYQLPLHEDKSKGKVKGMAESDDLGFVEVLVYYEPWSKATCWMVWRNIISSPKAISILASIWLVCTGAFVIVAGHGRWLCKGVSLRTCEGVEVQGIANATGRAAVYVLMVAALQFFGAMGAWGRDWNSSPPHVHDLLEDPEEEDVEDMMSKEKQKQLKHEIEEPSADVHIMFAKGGPSLIDYKVFLGLDNIKRWSMKNVKLTIRYAAFVFHMLAMMMLIVSAVWTELQRGEGMVWGEGVYFGLACLGSLVVTYRMFQQTSYVLTEDGEWRRPSKWIKRLYDDFEEVRNAELGIVGNAQQQVGRAGRAARERFLEPVKDKAGRWFPGFGRDEDDDPGDPEDYGSYQSGTSDVEGGQTQKAVHRGFCDTCGLGSSRR